MECVGSELSDIPFLAALIGMSIAATITTALSWIEIPIGLGMASVMTIGGLGWNRATRPITVREAMRGDTDMELATGALKTEPEAPMTKIGKAGSEEVLNADDLFISYR